MNRMNRATRLILVFTALIFSAGCAGYTSSGTSTGNPLVATTEDTSTSGAAAGAVGGALSGSSSSGTLALLLKRQFMRPWQSRFADDLSWLLPSALAGSSCPTFKTASGNGCTSSGTNMWLSYSTCSFAGSTATWTGTQGIFLSSGTATCGSYPTLSSVGTLTRQFVASAGSSTPSSITHVSSFGTSTTIDDSAANLGNFDSASIATISGGGYGAQVTFASGGARTGLVLGHRLTVGSALDHSVTGSLTVTETAGASSRTVNGTVTVYHNLLQIIGTSTFSGIVHSDACCLPISGTVSTLFSKGTSKSPRGTIANAMIGATETLQFTGCGTATLTTYSGSTLSVSLSRCY